MVLKKYQQEPFFVALLLFCKQDDCCIITNNYPVYRILRKYSSVYQELSFLKIHYEGHTLNL